ncbi:MAG: 2'-5' RNA ligase family protein [Candidatus Zixiibacteriota bacterium]
MQHAVTLTFDKEATSLLRSAWQSIVDAGLPQPLFNTDVRPHITLSVCGHLDKERFFIELKEWTASNLQFNIRISSVGLFTTNQLVLYYSITPTEYLIQLHRKFHDMFSHYAENVWDYFHPGIWVPHVTMSEGLKAEQISKAVNIASRFEFPLVCRAEEIVLVDVKKLREINAFKLGQGEATHPL